MQRSHDKEVLFSDEKSGAIDVLSCPSRHRGECRCNKLCARCGWPIHMSIHGPLFGEEPGTKPYGHVFVPEDK